MLTIAALNDVQVCISVSIGNARARVSDVLAFAEGTIVQLGTNADAPVELLVNGVAVAAGEIVELDDGKLAIEITSVFGTEARGLGDG